ncbi:MAG: thrombospondin type 3 repeat-containing protein [Agarilytica sp.]
MSLIKSSTTVVLCLLSSVSALVQGTETALDRYIAKPDAHYSWYEYYNDQQTLTDNYGLAMTSQQWRTEDEVDKPIWQHELEVSVPQEAVWLQKKTAVLLINGGSNRSSFPDREVDDLVTTLAALNGFVVATTNQVPNQRLKFTDEIDPRYIEEGRKEDEILAYSFDKFMETGDEEWPVHLPMTKAAVRSMDAIQEFVLQKHGLEIENFIILGGSKRGWTTWLTAAVDPRVKAIAPISIDLLDLNQQVDHHWEAYGYYADAILDYADFDLFCRMKSETGQDLLDIVDPISYNERFTMPKFVINSAGDQFFLPDSSLFYYDQLPEPKHLRYTVNTDHAQTDDIITVLQLTNWIKHHVNNTNPPRYSYRLEADGSIVVQNHSFGLTSVKLWSATNPNERNFRLDTIGDGYAAQTLLPNWDGTYTGRVSTPEQGWTAYMVELTYGDEVYTSPLRITPEALPFAGTHCAPEESDMDDDGISDTLDNCPSIANSNQHDSDEDGLGDLCDATPNGHTCTEDRTSTFNHLSAGRAHRCGNFNIYACANGSNDNLGRVSFFVTTTVSETAPGYYEERSCP